MARSSPVHTGTIRLVLMGAKGKAFEACTVGRGDVDLEGCLGALRQAGYDGFIALEYEGQDDERRGVADSIACMHKLIG